MILGAFFLISCSGYQSQSQDEFTRKYVEINCTFDYLKTGETRKYYVKQSPEGAGYELEWSSSDQNVATVDEEGLVEAVGSGETFISVNAKGTPYKSSCKITVADEIIEGEENNLQSIIDNVQNEGYVLIKSGYFPYIKVNKCLKITALGDAKLCSVDVEKDCVFYAENVQFYSAENLQNEAKITLSDNAGLVAVNCSFVYDCPTVDKPEKNSKIAVYAPSNSADVYLRACAFKGYEKCIYIKESDGRIYIVNNDFSLACDAITVDLRKSDGIDNSSAFGQVKDNVFLKCEKCAQLLFNGSIYRGKLEVDDADITVPL